MTDSGIDVTTTINGDAWVVSGADAEELYSLLKGLAENANDFHDKLTIFKQSGVANGVFTGTTPAAAASQSAPPVSAGSAPPTSSPPSCEHGPMVDKGGKVTKAGAPYKNRYYCSSFGSSCRARD